MLKIFILNKSNCKKNQFIKYFFVSGISFIVDFSIFFFFVNYLDVHYLIANVLAFLFGLTTNYILSVNFVFTNRKINHKMKEYILFANIGIIGLLINQVTLFVCIEKFEESLVVSKILSTIIVFLWNFSARKILLF